MSDWFAHLLATYAAQRWPSLEDDVTREAQRRVIDTVAVGVAALAEPGPVAARRYAAVVASDRGAAIWGSTLRASPETAALVNGVAMRNLDFSDSYFGIDSTHPSDLIPAAIALAETNGRSGRDVVEAIAVGYEISVAVANGFGLRRFGWDHTNVTMIGACCAFGRLLNLTVEQIEQALAITVVPHAVMLQTCFGALTMWKGYGAPDAMRQAVYACLLAQSGVQGAPEPFVGDRGFFHQMLHDDLGNREAFAGLDALIPPRRILDTHIKAWPVGYVGQSAVQAALDLAPRVPTLDEVERVDIDAFFVALDLMGSPDKWTPTTRETADHSVPFAVATALRDGRVDADSFRDELVLDPAMHAFLKERVHLAEDAAFTAAYPEAFPSRVSIRLQSGEVLVSEVTHPMGHARNPLSDEQLQDKLLDLATPNLGRARSLEVLDLLENLSELEDVGRLGELLAVEVEGDH